MASAAPVLIDSRHSDAVHDAQMDYYGKRLATCSSDRTVKIFSVLGDQQALLADLLGHEGPVWQVAWAHPRFGNLLASCSYDRRVIIWKEAAENQWIQEHVFCEHEASVNSISWAPQEAGLCLACASSDGSISFLSCASAASPWEVTRISQAHPAGVTSVSWAPAISPGAVSQVPQSLPRLVSGGCDNTVKIWKLSEKEAQWKMDCFPPLQHQDWVRDVAWAPNLGLPKTTIASASQDGTVMIWTQESEGSAWSGQLLKNFNTPMWRVAWSLTGNFLAVSDSSSTATLWKESTNGKWNEVAKVVQ